MAREKKGAAPGVVGQRTSDEIAAEQQTIPESYGAYLLLRPGASYAEWLSSPEAAQASELAREYNVAIHRERPVLAVWEAHAAVNNEIWARSAPKPITSPRQIGWHHGPDCQCEDCREDG